MSLGNYRVPSDWQQENIASRLHFQLFTLEGKGWLFSRVISWILIECLLGAIQKASKQMTTSLVTYPQTWVFSQDLLGEGKHFDFFFLLAHSSGCHSMSYGLGMPIGFPSFPSQIMLHLVLHFYSLNFLLHCSRHLPVTPESSALLTFTLHLHLWIWNVENSRNSVIDYLVLWKLSRDWHSLCKINVLCRT